MQEIDFINSVGGVWLSWIAGALVLAAIVRGSLHRLHWRKLILFFVSERGSTYALTYLLTFPFYLWLVCFMIQASIILVVKMGATYAAYSAARTAIVWWQSDPTSSNGRDHFAEHKSKRAAITAMTPFASSTRDHRRKMFPISSHVSALTELVNAQNYAHSYRRVANNNSDRDGNCGLGEASYVVQKYYYAALATRIDLEVEPRRNGDVKATLVFRMPIHIPGTGRLLGHRKWFTPIYYRDVISECTLPLEIAMTDNGRVGIPYNPKEL